MALTRSKYLLWTLVALVIRNYWLVQPLPSNSRVSIVPPAIAPTVLRYESNTALRNAVKVFQGRIIGAESVIVDRSNEDHATLYMLDRYGHVFSAPLSDIINPKNNHNSSSFSELHHLGFVGPGRPLGFHIHPITKHLIICDSLQGLTQLDLSTGRLSILANQADDNSGDDDDDDGGGGGDDDDDKGGDDNGQIKQHPITYANDLDISEVNGAIYFSDSTDIPPALNRGGFYDTMMSYMLTSLSGRASGRLLKYEMSTGRTEVLVSGLWFANGVALAHDESYVLVVETCSKKINKHWLTGPLAGTTQLLLEGFPGYPDGLTRASTPGEFWVAIILPDAPILRLVNSGGAVSRWMASWLLQLIPPPILRRWGMVMRINGETGRVLQVLMDPDGSVISGVSGVQEVDGRLFMGHLSGDYVSYVDLS